MIIGSAKARALKKSLSIWQTSGFEILFSMTSTWPSSFSIFAISSYSASMSNSGTITKGAYCNLAELLSCVFSVLKA